MKAGDLVKHVFSERFGIIIEKVYDPMAMSNDVFDIAWLNNTIGRNVWDYDLVVISEAQK